MNTVFGAVWAVFSGAHFGKGLESGGMSMKKCIRMDF